MKRAVLYIFISLLIAGCRVSKPANEFPRFKGFRLDSERQTQELLSYSKDRIPLVSAHRGGPYPGYPENCLETFNFVADKYPVLVECDVFMTKDDSLMMIHDSRLERTTTGRGPVGNKTYSELKSLKLKDNMGEVTVYRIPSFWEVLQWAKRKAVLTIDVKKGVPWERVLETLRRSGAAPYCSIITYSAKDAAKVHQIDPEIMISVTVRNREEYRRYRKAGIPDNRMIAFTGLTQRSPDFYKFLHKKGIMCIVGAIGNLDRRAQSKGNQLYAELIKGGGDIIATDRPLEANKAILPLVNKNSKIYQKYFK
ncbi:MAG: glycerophosphodiester phosphodiesterase family protein [Cytophagales bacterium]|nr:glycerophosphodiester phosphodiesterase family protein [Cytophagales bacterium]